MKVYKKIKCYLRLMRVSHWIKNLLILIPVFFGKGFWDSGTIHYEIILPLLFGFLCFCAFSSAIYIMNDLCDVEEDRLHPDKCRRPLASGSVQKGEARLLAALLFVAALVFDYLGSSFHIISLIPILYFFINILYSFHFKHRPLFDIILLVSGFFLRIFYGACITNIRISGLLYCTVIFLASFLAFGKRWSEKKLILSGNGVSRPVLEQYTESFLAFHTYLYLTLFIVFYTLWTLLASGTFELFPSMLTYSTLLVLVILMRYLYVLETGKTGDPVSLILHDIPILVLGAIYGIYLVLCIYFPEGMVLWK